jgi:hypothetical protein
MNHRVATDIALLMAISTPALTRSPHSTNAALEKHRQ